MKNKDMNLLKLLKRLQDPRCPRFGGYSYRSYARGMGRMILNLTAYAITRNGKVAVSNTPY